MVLRPQELYCCTSTTWPNCRTDENLIEELLGRARRWLDSKCRCTEEHVDKLQLVSKGRAFRPATKSGLPVISEVDPSDLTGELIDMGQSSNLSSGAFVCWGHGLYGLTLGMGTGKLMTQLICGEELDLDLSFFGISRHSALAKD